MKLIKLNDFKNYVSSLKVTRNIKFIQLHHTYSPSYEQFTGNNHMELQKAMRDYHVKIRGFADIAQQFTIFPDGKICTGRNINKIPAGIKGANTGAICIECLGNFDKGGDAMSDVQKDAIVGVVKILLERFGIDAKTGVVYHAWWTSGGTSLGTYVKGKSVKTCPGTNFFGGNTREAFEKNLLPLLKAEERTFLETGNDIVWELMNGKHKVPISEVKKAVKALDNAKNSPEFNSLYWIIYKIVNKGRI